MQNVNRIKLAKLLRSKKAIIVNNNFIKKTLGFDDMRDFYREIGDWGYVTDFTYRTEEYDNQRFLRRFLKETYLD